MDDVKEAEAELAEIQSSIENLEDDEENLDGEEEAELLELIRQKRTVECVKPSVHASIASH